MHAQVDYYNMLLVRKLGNDNKLDPNIIKQKHKKLRRRKWRRRRKRRGGEENRDDEGRNRGSGRKEGWEGGGKFLWN